jgi:hypothetical protein
MSIKRARTQAQVLQEREQVHREIQAKVPLIYGDTHMRHQKRLHLLVEQELKRRHGLRARVPIVSAPPWRFTGMSMQQILDSRYGAGSRPSGMGGSYLPRRLQ